jgi:peptide/nickel transport system permease protein
MNFVKFLIQRILASIPLLIAISLVSFGLIKAVPGDYADMWMSRAMSMSGQGYDVLKPQADALREHLGLNKPFIIQYFHWVWGIFTEWDFGPSFVQSRPVTEVMGLRLPRSLGLALTAHVFATLIGAGLGIYAALNQYKLGDILATVIAFIGITVPKFIISLVILYYLAFVLHSQYIGSLFSAEYVLQEHWSLGKFIDFLKHVWPVLAISIMAGQAYTLRMMRGNLLDVMKMPYIETARAKGLSERRIIFLHALPNALHPIIMNQGSRLDYMIKGEIEIAITMGIPTIGPLILTSVYQRDMYVVASIFILVAVMMILGNLIADILLALLDPRVRKATTGREA